MAIKIDEGIHSDNKGKQYNTFNGHKIERQITSCKKDSNIP